MFCKSVSFSLTCSAKEIKVPFMLSLSRIADAVTESNIFPHWEGMRLVVTRVVPVSDLFDMIWKRKSACSRKGRTYPGSSRQRIGIFA